MCASRERERERERERHTLWGAGSRGILALVMIPNCPRPPRTAWKSSVFCSSEHVNGSPLPIYTYIHIRENKYTETRITCKINNVMRII
jgi:hypothetical protein